MKQSEVVKKLAEAKRAKAAGDLTTSTMRVDAWLRYWLDNIVAHEVKPRTLADYRSKVERYLIPNLGRYRLDQLTPPRIRELHRTMRENGLSITTLAHTHHMLAGSLDAAMREVGLARNVARNVKAPGVAKSTRTGLTAEHAIAVLRATQHAPDAARWMFANTTGARQGETLGLRWGCVDFDAKEIHLAWALQRVPYRHGCAKPGQVPTCGHRPNGCPAKVLEVRDDLEHEILDGNLCLLRPKTAASIRVVPMIEPLEAALRRHLMVDTSPNPHRLVWHRPDGRPLDGRADYRRFLDLLTAAGAPKVTLHETRHTAVSLLAFLGIDPRTIARIVGHSDVLVQRAYTHVDNTTTREALERLGRLLELG
jgi:integrase